MRPSFRHNRRPRMKSAPCVLFSVMENDALVSAIGNRWREFFELTSDGVIVMDHERQLLFANRRARKLLGFRPGERVGGRCRLNTRGVDCEVACPLTFALEQGRSEIRDFETVYYSRDGRSVPLRVTVFPLFDQDGAFAGAVEVLKERTVDFGFFLAGPSHISEGLRQELTRCAAGMADVILVGERAARLDVAKTLHRMSGLGEDRFLCWPVDDPSSLEGSFGLCFAEDGHVEALEGQRFPSGWRRVFGVEQLDGFRLRREAETVVIELPPAGRLVDDLPFIMAAWIRQSRPELDIAPEALRWLGEVAVERGFDGVAEILPAVLAGANGRLEPGEVSRSVPQTLFIDQALDSEDPLGALERAFLVEVLERHDWKMQEAADQLGMSRVTLWRKTRDYGIERP